MSEPDALTNDELEELERAEPEEVHADDAASFWDIVGRQFAKNRPAVFAVWCVLGLIMLAAAAPLISMNIPYVMSTPEGIEWPLFERLFDRFVFPSGVDVFFNMLLVVGSFWLVGTAFVSALGLGPRPLRGVQAMLWGGLLAILTLFYIVWALPDRSRFGPLLLVGLSGFGLQILQGWRRSGAPVRKERAIRTQTRVLLAILFLAAFVWMLTDGYDTRETMVYRPYVDRLEETNAGWALRPLVFYHPDNVAEDDSVILAHQLKPPSFESRNLLGCDNNGRDVFARILFGTRISLTIGVIAVSIYVVIGIILGSIAGYFGGWIDNLILAVLQIMLCIPTIFLLLTIIAIFDTRSIFMIMLAIGLISWTGVTRLVRGEFMRHKNSDYVMAARALGIPKRRIIFGHILKNSMGPVLVAAAFGVGGAILALSLIHISEPTRLDARSRMPSSA